MNKWRRDCNGDGIMDCDDFAAIHKLGPHQCREESVTTTDYWREYEKCPATTAIEPRNSRSPNERRGAESAISASESITPNRANNHFNVPHIPSLLDAPGNNNNHRDTNAIS